MAEISQVTPESVWAVIHALAERQEENERMLAERHAENERMLIESRAKNEQMLIESRAKNEQMLAECRAENERRRVENEQMLTKSREENERMLTKRRAENERILAESRAENERVRAENERMLAESRAETDRRLDRVSETIEKLSLKVDMVTANIDRVNKMVGGLSNNHGSFAEEYFANALKKGNNNFFGEPFDKLVKFELVEDYPKIKTEFDIMLVNGKSVAIIEVKFKVHNKDIDKVLKKVNPFRKKFPEYKNHSIYLGLASMVFDENVEKDCITNGIAVIKQSGDAVVVYDENIKSFS